MTVIVQYASSLCEPIKWRSAFLGICHCKPKILFSWFLVKEEGKKKKKKLMVVHRGLQNFEKVANLGKLHSFSAPYSNGRLRCSW